MQSAGDVRDSVALKTNLRKVLALILVSAAIIILFTEAYAEESDSLQPLQKEGDWHLIEFPDQLWEIEKDMSASYRLVNDLDLSSYEGGMRPIGRPEGGEVTPFSGHFDGDNYTISGLQITGFYDKAGLFAEIDKAGKVERLTIKEAQVSGRDKIGILAGVSRGTVEGVKTSGEVFGRLMLGGLIGYLDQGTVVRSSSSAEVSGGDRIGGLIGFIVSGEVRKSFAEGDVYNKYYSPDTGGMGGLIGLMTDASRADQLYATGSVRGNYNSSVGGLIGAVRSGDESAYISNAFASGSVDGYFVGGLIGIAEKTVEIKNCLALGQVNEYSRYRGGLVASSSRGTSFISSFYDYQTTGVNRTIGDGTPKSTAQLQRIETYEGWSIRRAFPRHEDDYHYPRLCFSIPGCPLSGGLWVIHEKADDETTSPHPPDLPPPGDVTGSGDLTVEDAVLTMQYALNLRDDLTPEQVRAADVNGDGRVDVLDVILIVQYALGIIDSP